MKLIVTDQARSDLFDILVWNDRQYGEAHAGEYPRFLHSEAQRFVDEQRMGRSVAERPGTMFFNVSRRPRAHGHVFVYRLVPGALQILHVFHTAQDWIAKVEDL